MQDQIGESSVEHVDKKPKLTEELNEETADVQPLSTCNQVIKIIVQLSQAKLGNEITDDSKCQTAKQIIPLLWKLKEDEIIKTFDLPLCIELSSQFSRCRTKTELKLLETVEYIAKNAAENENELERQKFADIFAESGLYKMVKDSIRVRISYQDYDQSDEDEDFEQWMYEDDAQLLCRTFCYMYSISDSNDNLTLFSSQILDRNISFYVYMIKDQCKEFLKPKNEKRVYDEDELNYFIFQLEELLNVLKCILKEPKHRLRFASHSLIDMDLYPIFHIECPSCLKCPHCIVFPDDVYVDDLHLLVIEILSMFEEDMNRTQLYSVDVHNVVAHLAPNIISFAVRTSFQSKYQMTIELSQLPLIQTNEYIFAYQFAANLNLLHNLIIHNNRFASSVASSPNLLPILIAFTFYNQKDEEYNTVIKSRTDLIREQSIDIVSEVCKHCSEQIQRKDLIEMKFAQSLTLATNIKGGGKEQNISVIKSAKKCIDSIIPLLISAQNDKHSYFSLSSETDEEFEAQGGFEEFNIQL